MTVNKITTPPTPQEQIDKINEIIDNLSSGGSVDIDGVTITKNSSDEIQTVAVKDDRSGNAIKTWTGTKAQYNAIVTKDANTLYNITDDTDVTLSLLELLYPVGAIYVGTMAICPLQVLGVGTWQLVASDRVLQGAGTRGSVGSTVNESLPNIKGELDYICASNTQNNLGAFSVYTRETGTNKNTTTGGGENMYNLYLNAHDYSSTYQDNAPVQQNAYLVNIWERTA